MPTHKKRRTIAQRRDGTGVNVPTLCAMSGVDDDDEDEHIEHMGRHGTQRIWVMPMPLVTICLMGIVYSFRVFSGNVSTRCVNGALLHPLTSRGAIVAQRSETCSILRISIVYSIAILAGGVELCIIWCACRVRESFMVTYKLPLPLNRNHMKLALMIAKNKRSIYFRRIETKPVHARNV